MYQPERLRVYVPDDVPTYVFDGPRDSSVLVHYPSPLVTRRSDRSYVVLPESRTTYHDLGYSNYNVGEIKHQHISPNYYVVKEDYSHNGCSMCTASWSPPKHQQEQHLQIPLYYCTNCQCISDKRPYTAPRATRSKIPNTTYQASYRPPPSQSYGHFERPITLNELQSQPLPSTMPAQHSRHWIPSARKNAYPHRRWNLSVPHPEP